MQTKNLLKTNIIICVILLIGFTLTAVFSYKANYTNSLNNIEHVSSLTAEGIYYQITAMFTKPLNISMTMAHDSLLTTHLTEESEHLEDAAYVETTRNYLNAYQDKYGFDSVFLVSSESRRYYNFNGVDRVLSEDNSENNWYFDFINSGLDYNVNVDNDEVIGADNEITVFINCRIEDASKNVLGVVGVGIRIEHLKELLAEYEEKFHVEPYLIDADGSIEISTNYNGYEDADWFEIYGQQDIREQILSWEDCTSNLELWETSKQSDADKSFIVTRYIPELSWHLLIRHNTGETIQKIRSQVTLTCILVFFVILSVLTIITIIIRRFNKQIMALIEQQQDAFRTATEELYDNIYELNITQNCTVGERTKQYFASLGAEGPYDQGLITIAHKQIKEEYREGYLSTFSPENIIRVFEDGTDHLQYDFLITLDGKTYTWMRIDAHIFLNKQDGCIHMFTYRKNIDDEKRKEIQSNTDEMTGFLTKKATERMVERTLFDHPGAQYAFFMFDIDNFKTVNDRFGHAFGDFCIREFSRIIKLHFQESDIVGRIGGDEFAALFPVSDKDTAVKKAAELSAALNTLCENEDAKCHISASIGVAIAPQDGTDFDTIYKNADTALYRQKHNGKNGYTLYTG